MGIKITNGRKIDQMAIKYTNTFHCKTLQYLPKLEILVWKYTIWQPWTVCRQRIFFSKIWPPCVIGDPNIWTEIRADWSTFLLSRWLAD
jgi:hypothetical protein